jgi:hypothetical protein
MTAMQPLGTVPAATRVIRFGGRHARDVNRDSGPARRAVASAIGFDPRHGSTPVTSPAAQEWHSDLISLSTYSIVGDALLDKQLPICAPTSPRSG